MAHKQIHYKQQTLNISYEIINPNQKRDCVILHGWGSHKELMRDVFASHLGAFRHIYIDMPGFGNSTTSNATSSEEYREIIAAFLEDMSIRRDIIIGHSFGGKIATLLNPDFLVLLSSSGIPEPKPLKVWVKIYLAKLVKLLGLKNIGKFFVARDAKNLDARMYETFKGVVNEDFSSYFARFNNRALVCWGQEDEAVSMHAGRTISALMPHSRFESFSGDHYFFMHHAFEIAQRIEEMYINYKGDV